MHEFSGFSEQILFPEFTELFDCDLGFNSSFLDTVLEELVEEIYQTKNTKESVTTGNISFQIST